MKRVETLLQRLWLRKPGTYYCNISFYNDNEALDATVEGHCPLNVKRNGILWDIGPISGSNSDGDIYTFPSLKFACLLPESSILKPTIICLNLYQELPVSFPSTSQNAEIKTHLLLQASGVLQLMLPGKVLNSKHQDLKHGKEHTQRLMINSNISSGGIKFHLGSLILTSVIHEKYDEETFSTAKSVEMSLPVKSVSPILEEIDQPVTQARQSLAKLGSQYAVTRSSTLPNLMFEVRESLPALDAVKQILPMYYQLVKSPPDRCESVKPYLQIDEPIEELVDGISSPMTSAIPEKRNVSLTDDKSSFHLNAEKINADNEAKSVLDKHVITVLEYQTKELDRYRQAIRKMGELIVDLRSKISTLEMKNSQLRANVYYTGRSSRATVDDHDENSYTGSVKRDFMATVEEVEEQKISILKLQNELIKKNEYEKKYLKLLKAHQSQQAMLHDYQGKLSKYSLLEKTCKKQEKIIRELESNGTRSKSKKISLSDNTAERAKTVSFQEDPLFSKKYTQLVPLQNQVVQPASMQLVPNPLPSKKSYHDQFYDVEERITLLQKLEKAEGRIMALESQIMDNTRLWAREKSQNKFRIGNCIPDFSGFERRFPAPLTYPNDQIVFEDGFYGKPNPQLRGQDAFTRFHHL